MDLIINDNEIVLDQNDLEIEYRPVINDAIRHWRTLKSTSTLYNFSYADNNILELSEVDANYGSDIYLLKSNPLSQEWVEKFKTEITDVQNVFEGRIVIGELSLTVENHYTVKSTVTYIDQAHSEVDKEIDFNININ